MLICGCRINETIKMIEQFKEKLLKARHAIAFTGAGISVESGIPPFRGEHGIWNQYDPEVLDIDFFYRHPEQSWAVIREIFYSFFGEAKPNMAHLMLARLEQAGLLKAVITHPVVACHIMLIGSGTRNPACRSADSGTGRRPDPACGKTTQGR